MAQDYSNEGDPTTWSHCPLCGCSFDSDGDCCCGGATCSAYELCWCVDCGSYPCSLGCWCDYDYDDWGFGNDSYAITYYHGGNTSGGSEYNTTYYGVIPMVTITALSGGGSSGGGGGSVGWVYIPTPTPIPTPPAYSPMGDPIDPITGLENVTDRFNRDIELAFQEFCNDAYQFNITVNSYGNLVEGVFSYPHDFKDYIANFVNKVKTGAPWDLKAGGNGYSSYELGDKDYAMYNGTKYRKDDFGNITFGIAALAYGLPPEFALSGAGFYQVLSGTSEWSFISSYFDDPRDSEMIELGYSIFYENGGCGF